MPTMRFTARINRDVEDVWDAVSVPDTIAKWYPGVVESRTIDNVRTVRGETDVGSGECDDIIVTNDNVLRRFQYRVAGVQGHLATVDVIEIAKADSLAIYSVELDDQSLADAWAPLMRGGVEGLKRYVESLPL